ncbi:hypothetical protein G7046_g9437 [Stylonectria norvegica]|nr:hypothetical protein G7046_g9437 [Stylonectria norvegica]
MSRPTGLIATKGIELLTFSTPNGYKASVLLEELKEAYGLQYTVQSIHIGQDIQKEPWFVAVNPNGRIPAIVDHDNKGLAVFEGNAILSYLTRKYDPEHRFSFAGDDDDYTRAEAWIGWQHGKAKPTTSSTPPKRRSPTAYSATSAKQSASTGSSTRASPRATT